jgi:hypothetical protein
MNVHHCRSISTSVVTQLVTHRPRDVAKSARNPRNQMKLAPPHAACIAIPHRPFHRAGLAGTVAPTPDLAPNSPCQLQSRRAPVRRWSRGVSKVWAGPDCHTAADTRSTPGPSEILSRAGRRSSIGATRGVGEVVGSRRCPCDGVARDVAVAVTLSGTVWPM